MDTDANPPHSLTAIAPEARVVLACLRAVTAQCNAEGLGGLIALRPDWKVVARIASWHGVLPLVVNRLGAEPGSAVARDALTRLRAEYFGRALRSASLARELLRLYRLIDSAGIAMLALKGPVLAVQAYGDVTMRQFTDLDVLIRRADLPRVVEILSRDGYRPRRFIHDARDQGLFDSSEEEFTKPGALGLIDVHWLLSSPFFPYAPDADSCFAHAVQVDLEGTGVPTLAPRELLLFLCVHAAKHGWPTLGAAADIAAVARRYPALEWEAVDGDARRIGCRRMLLLGVHLAHELADAPVPESLLLAARSDSSVARLAAEIRRRMFAAVDARPTLYQEWIVPLRAIETARGRLRYCALRALTPTAEDREFVSLPDAFTPLYYLLRPLRLAAHQGSRLFRTAPSPASGDAAR